MSFNYIEYRKIKRSGRYKLFKRTAMMLEMVSKYKPERSITILDVGAADGFMLDAFKKQLNTQVCVGIEPSLDFIKANTLGSCKILQAICENMPFKSHTFDTITAASVIDHMDDPYLFLRECRRVLKDEGVIAISLAAHFYDTLAVRCKIKEDDHKFHFTELKLRGALEKEGFCVKEISRFALPFFGIFFERHIEKILNAIGLKWMMFYIIAVAQAENNK